MRGVHVAVADFHDFFSAISPDPASIPSHVSFDVRWPGGGERQKIRDDQFKFAGSYVTSPTTISFTASDDHSGVVYTSDPGGQFNPTVAQLGAGSPAVGIERNGRFFR
jgi:cytochrome oxidase Cu insertion factor (SCO1/SenC/PrrC family)